MSLVGRATLHYCSSATAAAAAALAAPSSSCSAAVLTLSSAGSAAQASPSSSVFAKVLSPSIHRQILHHRILSTKFYGILLPTIYSSSPSTSVLASIYNVDSTSSIHLHPFSIKSDPIYVFVLSQNFGANGPKKTLNITIHISIVHAEHKML